MTDLIEKARQGRANALAGLGNGADVGARQRSSIRHEKVTFISSRARMLGNGFMG